jgi:hypothetical protein
MWEAKWLACTNSQTMIRSLGPETSERRFALYFCACARSVADWVADDRVCQAVMVVENYADGLAGRKELDEARALFPPVEDVYTGAPDGFADALGAYSTGTGTARNMAESISGTAPTHLVFDPEFLDPELPDSIAADVQYDDETLDAVDAQELHQCDLIRHIFGNPFRPYVPDKPFPSSVIQLAGALYAGEDCAFALHDALLESGYPELAEHFRDDSAHPKGCWVIDLLRGKE